MKFLVVDDHALIREALRGVLVELQRDAVVLEAGTCGEMSPFNAFQFIQGLETLPLRMREHCRNAAAVALHLQNHRDVARVIYAGLHDDAEQRRRANKYLTGFGGIVGFELSRAARRARASSTRSRCSITSPTSAMRARSPSIWPAPRTRN